MDQHKYNRTRALQQVYSQIARRRKSENRNVCILKMSSREGRGKAWLQTYALHHSRSLAKSNDSKKLSRHGLGR